MRPKVTTVEVLRIRVAVFTGQIHEIEREDRLSFVPQPPCKQGFNIVPSPTTHIKSAVAEL